MTDNRSLLERAEEWRDHPVKANQQWPSEIRGLILGLAAALRAAEADLATAREDRDAYKALYDDLHEATGCVDGYAVDQLRADLATARTLASEAAASGRFDALLGHLLASVPPPTSREEP